MQCLYVRVCGDLYVFMYFFKKKKVCFPFWFFHNILEYTQYNGMVAMVRVRDSIVQHRKFHAIFAVAALHKQQYVVHIIVSANSTS